jgi:hypothetical protein
MNASVSDAAAGANITVAGEFKAQADLAGLRNRFCNRRDVSIDGNRRVASVSDDCLLIT